MIETIVLSYLLEHSGRLNESKISRGNDPVTGIRASHEGLSHIPGTTLKDACKGLGIHVGSAMK